MILSRSTRSSHETVHFLLGLVALAALTALCFWLDFRVVSAAFAYLILIVLLSFGVAIIPLAVLSLIAVGALNYFFVTPIFNFRVEYQEDIITLAAFLITSLVVTGLVKRTRAALVDQVLTSEKLREAQMQLTHVNRVATVGQLAASISHEVTQPIGALVTNAQAAMRMLNAHSPDLKQVRDALDDIIKDGRRVGEIIQRIRALVKKAPAQTDLLDINEIITETIALTRGEILRNGVSLETQLAKRLPLVRGDRIQLQQVIMNLLMNAVEAMSVVDEGTRGLQIATNKDRENYVSITVSDSGPMLKPESLNRFFEAFYSTKPTGMGIGLSICRSIVEAHDGRIWASANVPRGAVLHITLPSSPKAAAP
jgi:C4-dicarboxylate-specific signal transduction histidine kinase